MRAFLERIFELLVLVALVLGAIWFFAGVHPKDVPDWIMGKYTTSKEVVSEGTDDFKSSAVRFGNRDDERLERAAQKLEQ